MALPRPTKGQISSTTTDLMVTSSAGSVSGYALYSARGEASESLSFSSPVALTPEAGRPLDPLTPAYNCTSCDLKHPDVSQASSQLVAGRMYYVRTRTLAWPAASGGGLGNYGPRAESAWSDASGWAMRARNGRLTFPQVSPESVTVNADLRSATFANELGDAESVRLEVSKSSTFATIEQAVEMARLSSSLFYLWAAQVTDLDQNTVYYFRAIAKDAMLRDGLNEGGVQSYYQARTPPTEAPYVADVSSGVDWIRYTARLANNTFVRRWITDLVRIDGPGGAPITRDSTSPTFHWTNLAPGGLYRVRVRVEYLDGTISGNSLWYDIQLTSDGAPYPGQYFDGNTPDTDIFEYDWDGNPNSSSSSVTGRRPKGWMYADDVNQGSITDPYQTPDSSRPGGVKARYRVLADSPSSELAFNVGMGTPGEAATRVEVLPDTPFTGSFEVTTAADHQISAAIVWYDAAGDLIPQVALGDFFQVLAGVPTRLHVTGFAPSNAATAIVSAYGLPAPDTETYLAGETIDLDRGMFNIGGLADYFDGGTPSTWRFDYSWEGVPHDSDSIRQVNPSGIAPDPLADPDCPPAGRPPVPPRVPNSCVDEDIELWRRYWFRLPADEISSHLAMLPTIRVISGPSATRQIRVSVYPNPDDLPPEQIAMDSWMSQQIITYLPVNTTIVLDSVRESATAIMGDGSVAPAGRLVVGPAGEPPSWPELGCGMSYFVTIDTDYDEPAGNFDVEITTVTRFG